MLFREQKNKSLNDAEDAGETQSPSDLVGKAATTREKQMDEWMKEEENEKLREDDWEQRAKKSICLQVDQDKCGRRTW